MTFYQGGTRTLQGVRKDEDHFQTLTVPDEFWGDADRNNPFDMFMKLPIGDRLFIDSILQDKPIQPNFYDGFKVQEVIDAALKSHETGQWVTLPN
jgi:predicted dehydrogenase